MEKTNNGKKGGWLVGKRHYDKSGKPIGGIPAVVGDSKRPVELEGGEVIINREASRKYWRELSKINQSAGNGVPIKPQDVGADEDPEEFREGGKVIEFNPNHIPNKRIYNYAKSIKKDHPEIWDLGGNIFGNEAFNNLERVIKRGYWTDSEEWMYVKWRSYVARHKQDFRIAGVIAMLKWVDKVDKGWDYMKNLIEEEIEKRKPKKKTGGVVTYKKKYNKKYGYKENESHDLEQVSKDTGVSEKGLQQIYNKGVGAYKTNPQSVRPNVKSKEQWAMARVYSAVMGGKAARVDANELRMENGGDVDDIFEITTYYVTAHTDSFINEIYIGNDYKRAVSEFNSSNTTEDVGSDLGGTILFQKKTEKYKFVGDLEDGAYDISDFPFEDFYNDKDYYELIEEGEIEDIDSKTVNPVNEKTDELLYDVRKHYGDSKYNTIVVDNGEEQSSDNYREYGCIQLRIADHSENVKNIDRAGNCEYYISVVIANKDATKGKFAASVYERKRNEVELNFDSNSTFDEIISNIDSAIEKGKKYIIGKDKMRNGGKIENKLKNNAHEKPKTSKNETKNIEKAISYISRGVATVKNQQSRSLSENRLKDLEAQLAFEFAKSNNLWIEDLDLLAKPIAGGGNENSLYYDEEKGIIYKSNNLYNSDFSILKYLNYILNHNSLFKNTQYEFVGFTGFSNGYDDIKSAIPYIEPVVCQKFIVGKNSSEDEIKKHMESLGYNKTNEHTYENNQFLISDLRPRKILKDENGNIFVIDNIIKEKGSKKMENGGIVLPEQGTMLTKDKKIKLDYKKVGNNYEFVVYEGETNPVENYSRTSFKKKDKNVVTMDYNQFINYLYEEGYIDNKMKNGGNVDFKNWMKMNPPNQHGISHFELNDGTAVEIDWSNSKILLEKKLYGLNYVKRIEDYSSKKFDERNEMYEKFMDRVKELSTGNLEFEISENRRSLNQKMENGGEVKNDFKYSKEFAGITIYTNEEQEYAGKNYSPFESKGSFKANVRKGDLENIAIDSKELGSFNFQWGYDWKLIAQKLKNKGINKLELYRVGKVIKTYELRPLEKMENGGATSWDKIASSSARFKPSESVVFEPPLVGLNGAKLTSYKWAYEMTMLPNWEGELVGKRVSDWTQAEMSAETGRGIVHQYTVELPNGEVRTVSSESVPILLGYQDRTQAKVFGNLATASKTLAKQQMKLAIMEAQKKEYDELVAKFEKEPKPEVKIAEFKELPFITQKVIERESESGKIPSFTYFKMGDAIYSQDNQYDYNKSSYIPAQNPDKRTIEQLTYNWVSNRVKEAGAENPRGLYDLKNRVARQKRKVENMLNPKMENGGELAKGIKTEQEHKKTLEKIASGEITVDEAIKMTAKDHLKENPKYYTELSKIEKHEVGGALSGYSLNTPTGEKSRLTYLQQILVRTQKFKDFFGDWEVAAKSYLLDEKDNFQKHYKNVSKVLDMVTLEPRVVYHGTRSDAEFFTFDVSMEKGQGRPYAYFAHNKEYSKNFTEFSQRNHSSSQPYLYECFLNIRNPFMAMGSQYELKKKDYEGWINTITGTIAWDKYGTIQKNEETKRLEKAIRLQIEEYASSLPDDKNQFWKLMARDTSSIFKFFLISYGYDGVFYGEEIATQFDETDPKQYTNAVTVFSAKDIKLADGRNLNFNPVETDIRYKDGGAIEKPQAKMSKKDRLGSILFGEKYEKGGFINESIGVDYIEKPMEESRLFVEELNKKMKE